MALTRLSVTLKKSRALTVQAKTNSKRDLKIWLELKNYSRRLL